jgi:hypothetical protein
MNVLITAWADKVPDPNDVKAGWVAFAVFIGLIIAVAFLGLSLTKHLRRARDNADRGAFGPTETTPESTAESATETPSESPS